MARFHTYDDHGEFGKDLVGDIEFLEASSDKEAEESLREFGLSDEIIDEAIEAAQAVLEKHEASAFIAELSVEELDIEIKEKCRCGSRCVARKCTPYQRCWTENGHRVCVKGHRKTCTRRACNPC